MNEHSAHRSSPEQSRLPSPPRPGLGSRLLSLAQFPLAILITVGVLAYLLWPEGPPAEEAAPTAPEVEIVKLVGQHRLAITAGTPLEKKLAVAPVVQQETEAKLKVIGAVVARVPPARRPHPLPLSRGRGSVLTARQQEKQPSPPAAQRRTREPAEGRWDFNTPDLASAYADWLKARADVPF